ncbi:MAG: VWA domain-containing protein [Candidatus Levybacteria bacterium]|nr:VWA domain-containing protein [Candidatus Levybacteria bacterium]
MKRFKDKRKVISLTIVGVAYAMIVLPLIVSNISKQQEIRSRADVATPSATQELTGEVILQSSQSQCTANGNAEIGVSYTNTSSTRSLNVTATDKASGKSVSLGTIAPEESKTGIITVGNNAVSSGQVNFNVTYADNASPAEERTASYSAITCQNMLSSQSSVAADVPATCGNVTTDIVLIIDRSGSMGQADKLVQAKNSAKNFIDVVAAQEESTRVSMVSFSNTSTLSSPLTNDYNSVKSKIDALTASGNTCQECGIAEANKEIASKGRPGVKKVVVMLTDGQANWIVGGTSQVEPSEGEARALAAVKSGFSASKTVFFTIGLGDVAGEGNSKFFSPEYMRQVAELTGGKFYFPAPSELEEVYQEISQLIGKGLLGGFVFSDVNMNGNFDTNEPKLSGWTIQATSSAGTKTATTNATGNYTLPGLCDGSYKLSQQMKPGWTQTSPADPSGYAITISNAGQFNDKHFGNTDKARCSDNVDNDNNGFKDADDSTCHTDGNPKNPASYDPKKDGERGGGNTCADSKDNNGDGLIDGGDPVCHKDSDPKNPASYDPNLPEDTTTIGVTVFLDGIGNRGDNTNPIDFSLSNKNPKHPTISADIQVFNLSNQIVASGAGTITYNTATGNYLGDIPMQSGFISGQYTLKVKADTYLRRQVNGIQNINLGQKNKITPLSLVAGDIDNNNSLNILDYNALLDCYSDISAAANCASAEKRVRTDLNDDDAVNQVDYNLFLREIATQPGQ